MAHLLRRRRVASVVEHRALQHLAEECRPTAVPCEQRGTCGEPTAGISYESVASRIRAQVPQLLEKHKAKNIEFKVVIKGGRAVLKAIPHA